MTAMIHEAVGQTAAIDHISFPGTNVTARMYDIPNIRTRESTIATDTNTPGFQRAPAEASSFFAYESAVDELAVALGMDPIELRLKNEPKVDPVCTAARPLTLMIRPQPCSSINGTAARAVLR